MGFQIDNQKMMKEKNSRKGWSQGPKEEYHDFWGITGT
jgi:hypothetical protein